LESKGKSIVKSFSDSHYLRPSSIMICSTVHHFIKPVKEHAEKSAPPKIRSIIDGEAERG
jgi:hypothetical protein